MNIKYKCKRCDKVVTAIITERPFANGEKPNELHNRLDCTECGKYIKFIGKKELRELLISVSAYDDLPDPAYDDLPDVSLSEINFKLDLIIDHLGIKNGKRNTAI